MVKAVVLRLRRTTGTIFDQRVLPQCHRPSHHSEARKCEAGKADNAANPTVLQRTAQKRPCTKEKPAGAEGTRFESSYGAMRTRGVE